MKYIDYNYIQASQLSIGTSSWGSRVGKRNASFVLDILNEAGVNTIDTASSYGLGFAESMIGELLRGRRSQYFISTKVGMPYTQAPFHKRLVLPLVRPLYQNRFIKSRLKKASSKFMSPEELLSLESFKQSIYQSLKKLKTDYLDQVIVHCNAYKYLECSPYYDLLCTLKDKQIIRNIGVSLMEGSEIDKLNTMTHLSMIDTIQIPFSYYPIIDECVKDKYLNYFSIFSSLGQDGSIESIKKAINGHQVGHFIVAMSTKESIQKNLQLFSG